MHYRLGSMVALVFEDLRRVPDFVKSILRAKMNAHAT